MEAIFSSNVDAELNKVAPFLPGESHHVIGELLQRIPCTLTPVRVRRSKHGDHRPNPSDRTSLITINVCGNQYQFLLTLLHELAHANTFQSWGWRSAPHGRRWQGSFRKLVEHAVANRCFPTDVLPELKAHIIRPSSTSFRDLRLQKALRRYDTLDQRPFVADLPHSALFSLDGKQVFRLGKKLRKNYECVTLDGRKYYVAATARVQSVY
jgi:SprT protein